MDSASGVQSVTLACVSNNEAVLDNNLRRSPMLSHMGARLHVERGAKSASAGYNKSIEATNEELIVFLHQDVFLPQGWDDLLRARIREVEVVDPQWALIGCFGIGAEDNVGYGPVWSSSLGQIVGRVAERPVRVQSFDEMLFVLRRSSGLRFDEGLMGFHFYGTDIVQIAAARGLNAYSVPLPCIHNDKFKGKLDPDYGNAYHYMRRKWRAQLPLCVPTITISWHGLNLTRSRLRDARDISFRHDMAQAVDIDPRLYAARCGWNELRP